MIEVLQGKWTKRNLKSADEVARRGSLLDYLYDTAVDDSTIALVHRPKLRRKTWTYAAIARTAFQVARELEARSVGHGDRVVIWDENSPEWVAAFYGCMLRGAIAVPLDEQSSPDFVERVFEQTDPRLLFLGSGVRWTEKHISTLTLRDLSSVVARHSAEIYSLDTIRPDDIVEIVFTSGTTATPKGVVLTHQNMLANLQPIEREVRKYVSWKRLIDPLKIVCVLPLSHVFGQMMGIFIPQMLGATVVFQNRLNPTEIVETIRRERAMVLASVPRVLETLQHKVEAEYEKRGELEKLRGLPQKERSWLKAWWAFRRVHRMFGLKFVSFVTGGATLDESVELFWRKLGFAVVQGYGMTETAALISLNNPFLSRRGSLGQILSGRANVRLGKGGEILVRGKNISPGYWGEEVRGNEDEWLDTGDVGAVDESGRLYFKGRKKDVIVTSAGLNVYPEDIEAALNAQLAVLRAAVVGVDLGAGPEAAAALILKSGSDAAAVVERANNILAEYQRIRHWIEWPEADFPRTPTQKVRKNLVADLIMQRLKGGENKDASTSWLADVLSRLNRSARGLRPDSRLSEDLNLDSLSRIDLLSAIEDRYQIDLDEAAFTASTTVADIEKMVRAEDHGETETPRFRYPRWPLKFPISWIRPVFYELVIYPITLILAWVNVRGTDNLTAIRGPAVFASNHVTYVDPALVMSAMPRRFRKRLAIAMDGERLRGYLHPPKGTGLIERMRLFFTYLLVVTFFNVFPLPRYSGFRESFSFAGEAMDRGYNILIFPEGELTRGGTLQKFKSGTGILTNGLEAPLVPVSITGLYELRHAGQRGYAPPGSVTITFGDPVPYDPGATPHEITVKLEDRIKALQADAGL